MNITRAMSISFQKKGGKGVMSVGRVQSAVLALIVDVERRIKKFKPTAYYVPTSTVEKDGLQFSLTFSTKNNDGYGANLEGYMTDENCSKRVLSSLQKGLVVSDYIERKSASRAPLPFTLGTMQRAAAKAMGIGIKEVAALGQSLYEKGMISYNRTECAYLPEEQFGQAPEILKAVAKHSDDFKRLCTNADTNIQSAAWNTSKVAESSHHGIIPTAKYDSSATELELKLYEIVAKQYIIQFYPDSITVNQKIEARTHDGYIFTANGAKTIESGWKKILGGIQDRPLPTYSKGESLNIVGVMNDIKETSPPKRYTEASILEAMESVHRVLPDGKEKQMLKETSGIGTPATRTGIVETLKNRKFVMLKNKSIIPTEIGEALYDASPQTVRSPVFTAILEDKLKDIEKKKIDGKSVLKEVVEIVKLQTIKASEANFSKESIELSKTLNQQNYKKKATRKKRYQRKPS
jgi:DNA topoisomerase-3